MKGNKFLLFGFLFISILCNCALLKQRSKLGNELVYKNLKVAELNRNITEKDTEIFRLKTQMMALMNGLDVIAGSNEKIESTTFDMGRETISIYVGKNWNKYLIDRSGKLFIHESYSCGSDCVGDKISKMYIRPIKQHLLDYLLTK